MVDAPPSDHAQGKDAAVLVAVVDVIDVLREVGEGLKAGAALGIYGHDAADSRGAQAPAQSHVHPLRRHPLDALRLKHLRAGVPEKEVAQEEAEAITDAAERLAFLQECPDREDIRMVVGVLRGGQSWCTLRSRSHDDDASLYQGERLVPGLVEALAATFL